MIHPAAHPLSRREVLRRAALGFGGLALAGLLRDEAAASAAASGRTLGLPPSPGHTPARAKNVIFLYMEGGVSQVDSFDYKPMLEKHHGEDPRTAIGRLEKTQFDNIGKVLKSPWAFRQHGESGLWVSELFPHTARHADKLCVIRSMTSKFPEHTSANYFLHSGTGLQGRPSMGAWAAYGLGSHNRDLPGFIVLNGGQIPSGGLDNFSSGFLPANYQGSLFNAHGTPVANVRPREASERIQALKRRLVGQLNRDRLPLAADTADTAASAGALEAAILNYELAARMQLAVPELMDLEGESEATRRLYGLDAEFEHTRTYARQCLVARRLIERGVRFVELTIPSMGLDRWDAHGNLVDNHGKNALAVDQPIGALLTDLEARGLMDETLVVWSGEFGRTPFAQGNNGRDHNEHGFSLWLAGAGVRGGMTYGATDEWGYKAVDKPLEIHDLHATMLHLLGIDHERLTYRFSGRDIRLTDVHGKVVHDILT